jgi:hypothetical protein
LRFDGATRQSILEVVPLAGGSSRELFREVNTGPTRYSGLAWSVDGQQIFVVRDMSRQKTAASFAIWSVPASGGSATPTRLTFGDLPRQLAIDPAGGHLAVGLTSVHAESGVWILQNYLTAR